MKSLSIYDRFNKTNNLFDLMNVFDDRFYTDFAADLKPKDSLSSLASQMSFNSEKSQWEFTLELAGVAKNELKIDAREGHLEVKGDKKKGVRTGEFTRTFALPEGIDYDKIEALFEDGILTMTMPLVEKKAAKAITIK